MFKKILTLAALITISAFLFGCQQDESTGANIGVVDTNVVFKECKAGAEGMEYLKNASETFQSTFTEMQKELAGNQTEDNARKFQEALGEYQAKMGAEQTRIVEALNAGFTTAVDKYRTEKGLSAVLSMESAISYDKDADITAAIIEEMNKMNIKVTP
ncbi:MAG: outer membrane chaperone Skp [Desulfovibrio sp. S3730MH75]|nr:MAG: outer membrane chaperone Skp [Desulfovibrio sp. S3730MH75]